MSLRCQPVDHCSVQSFNGLSLQSTSYQCDNRIPGLLAKGDGVELPYDSMAKPRERL